MAPYSSTSQINSSDSSIPPPVSGGRTLLSPSKFHDKFASMNPSRVRDKFHLSPPLVCDTLNQINIPIPSLLTGNRKRVRFASRPKVFEIEARSKMSQDVVNTLWISDEERKETECECKKMVACLESGKKVECERGLRHYTKDVTERRKDVKRNASEAIFGTQKFYNLKKVPVECVMQELYAVYSEPAHKEAFLRGLDDEASIWG